MKEGIKIIPNSEKPLEIEDLETQLRRQHDIEKQELKKALGPKNEEMYNNLREEDVDKTAALVRSEQERSDLEKDFSEMAAIVDAKIAQYREAIIDSVTGLQQRRMLFQRLDEKLGKILMLEGTEQAGEIERRISMLEGQPQKLTVMVGDVSYLSLANKPGHRYGDDLLRRVSQTVSSHELKAFRHGGDEITAIAENDSQAIEAIKDSIRHKVRELENVDNFDAYGLKPNVDIGAARLDEAITAYGKLREKMQEAGIEREAHPVKRLENLWVEIADKRSFIAKGRARIPLLIRKYRENPDNYRAIVDYLRKGGYDITDREVGEMADKADVNNPDDPAIKEFIENKEQEMISKLDGYERIKAELVYELAAAGADRER